MKTQYLLLAVLTGCAGQPLPTSRPLTSPLPLYAAALEEAVEHYEAEVVQAASHPAVIPDRSISIDRYAELLEASFNARGLTTAGYRRLARQRPRFYFTQNALYAERLARLEAIARTVSAGGDMLAEESGASY